MFRLGIKAFVQNIYSNLFIAFQLAFSLLLTILITSSVLSKSELYTPFENILKRNGIVINLHMPQSDNIFYKNQDIDKIYSMYTADGTFAEKGISTAEGKNNIYALSGDLINIYSPMIKNGQWLDKSDNISGKIYGVITENSYGYKLGDIVKVNYVEYSPDDTNFINPIIKSYDIEISGVISDNSKIPNVSGIQTDEDFDFRNFYYNYSSKKDIYPYIFVSYDQLQKNNIPAMQSNFQFAVFDKGEKDLSVVKNNMNAYGTTYLFRDIQTESQRFINSELIKLLPLLICIFTLVIVSSVSISALSVKSQLKSYGIYYLCGSPWNKCLIINLINNLLTEFFSCIIAVILAVLFRLFSSESIIFSFGFYQIAICSVILIFNLLLSFIIPIGLMKRNAPKDIIANYE